MHARQPSVGVQRCTPKRTVASAILGHGGLCAVLANLHYLFASPTAAYAKQPACTCRNNRVVLPKQAHITAAIVDYQTPHKRRKRGVCTAWLARLTGTQSCAQPSSPVPRVSTTGRDQVHKPQPSQGDRVPLWVDRGVLHLPAHPSRPLVMVGPGTGVAPFRSFLEERAALQAAGGLGLAWRCLQQDLPAFHHSRWQTSFSS